MCALHYALQQFFRIFFHLLRSQKIGRDENRCQNWTVSPRVASERLDQIVADPHVGSFSLFSSPLPQNRSVPPVRDPPAVSRIYFVDVSQHFSISSDCFASIDSLLCKLALKCTGLATGTLFLPGLASTAPMRSAQLFSAGF